MTNIADPDQLPTDLDLHCLQRQGMSGSAGPGLRCLTTSDKCSNDNHYEKRAYIIFNPLIPLLLAHLSLRLKVSYCDHPLSVVVVVRLSVHNL